MRRQWFVRTRTAARLYWQVPVCKANLTQVLPIKNLEQLCKKQPQKISLASAVTPSKVLLRSFQYNPTGS
jgi:hypothetical protein